MFRHCVIIALALALSCGGAPSTPGRPDAGNPSDPADSGGHGDSGVPADAGTADGGLEDAGVGDAGATDAGPISLMILPPAPHVYWREGLSLGLGNAELSQYPFSWQVLPGGVGGTITQQGVYQAPSTSGTDVVMVTAAPPSGATALVTVTVDEAPPSVTGFDPQEGDPGQFIAVFGTAMESATAVRLNGVPAWFSFFDYGYLQVRVPDGAASGPIEVDFPSGTVRSQADFVIVPPWPRLDYLNPAAAGVGAVVSVSGHHLQGAQIRFGDLLAESSEVNAVGGKARVPEGAVSAQVRAFGPGGGKPTGPVFQVLPPLVMEPPSGAVGARVVLQGAGLDSVSAVSLAGLDAAYTVDSPQQITALVPQRATSGRFSVTTSTGIYTTPVFHVPVTGEQRLLIMRISVAGVDAPCSNEEFQSEFLGATSSAGAFWTAVSGGRVTVTGDVIGPLQLPFTDRCFVTNDWFSAADAAATAAGYHAASYGHRVYVIPGNCGFPPSAIPGLILIPAVSCSGDSYITAAHELGHSMGLSHASTPLEEYGDLSDVMGGAEIGSPLPPNAVHRDQLGWLEDSAVADVGSGKYGLSALGSADGTQVLRVQGARTRLYLSVRTRSAPNEATLPDAFDGKLSVHAWDGSNATAGLYGPSELRAVLGDGESFVSPFDGVSVTLLNHDGGSAQVQVAVGAATCQRHSPAIELPAPLLTGKPGDSLQFDVVVHNLDDGPGCIPTEFSTGAGGSAAGGWQLSAPQTLSVEAGGSATLHIQVTAPAAAPDQDWQFLASIRDPLDLAGHPWLISDFLTFRVRAQ